MVPVRVLAVAWEAVPVLAVVPEVLARPLALPRSFDGEGTRTLTKATQRDRVERNGSARSCPAEVRKGWPGTWAEYSIRRVD